MPAGRGQVALEFLAVLAIALVLFLLLRVSIGQEGAQAGRAQLQAEALGLARGTAALFAAAGAQRGYYAEFAVPERLMGGSANYTLSAYNDTLVVQFEGEAVSVGFPALAVRNATRFAPILIGAGLRTVTNANGVLNID